MIILIAGASHTGKTALAQKLLEKYKYPYLSIDHLKMGLIRSGNTELMPEDDDELVDYLWPIVREMVKTAIENHQNLIVEGGYIPFDWQKDFEKTYLAEIKYYCLVMTESYIRNHFDRIKEYASVIESRLDDSWCTMESVLEENMHNLEMCQKYGVNYVLIDGDYQVDIEKKNYYGSLCTEMYEILHKEAPRDELDFYLSYAQKGKSILEPLCGSGRFLVPFLEKGFDIKGVDNSQEMLAKLLEKAPDAKVTKSGIEKYQTSERFDYIFISSGSVSLFTDMKSCKNILVKMKSLLKTDGKFVFAVDTIADRCPDSNEYQVSVSVETKENYQLVLKSKSYYEEATHTQFGPSLYELYNGDELLKRETMDFQTHLYELGEMEAILAEIGFTKVKVYSTFDKEIAQTNDTEMFLYECSF